MRGEFPGTKAGEVADRSSDVSFYFPNAEKRGANYHLNVCPCAYVWTRGKQLLQTALSVRVCKC